jgi:hypothetical protein
MGVSGAMRGLFAVMGIGKLLLVVAVEDGFTATQAGNIRYYFFLVACSKRVHCANALRIGSSCLLVIRLQILRMRMPHS